MSGQTHHRVDSQRSRASGYPDQVIASLDALTGRLGLSRSEQARIAAQQERTFPRICQSLAANRLVTSVSAGNRQQLHRGSPTVTYWIPA
jgi:hypothetical protein